MFWHKDWYIVFWVLIPLIVILILFFLIWASRKQSPSSKKAVFVSSFADTSTVVPPTIRRLRSQNGFHSNLGTEMQSPPFGGRGSSVNDGYASEGRNRREISTM